MKKTNRSYFVVIIVVVVMAIVAIVSEFFVLKKQISYEVENEKQAYLSAKEKYDEAYEEIIIKQTSWLKTIEELSEKAKESEMLYEEARLELESIYEQRQEAIQNENTRWNALSDEEKEAEKLIKSNNEMISSLRLSNEEYNNIYITLCNYLGRDYSSLSSQEKKEYYKAAQEKRRIEKEYLENSGLEGE